jgi:putative ABC transport system ATP-binding protein
MIILEVENLKKYYGAGDTQVKALDGVCLAVEKGEFVSVMGSSGSGKTTLLHMMGGLDKPTEGRVTVADKEITALPDDELTIFRRRNIGFVFQYYNLIPVINVYDNIVLPLQLDNAMIDLLHVENIINLLGLQDKITSRPNQLSGGQQQRVAIARALATKPAIVLADEPTGNLDSKTSAGVIDLLSEASENFGQTIVMITHNESAANRADRCIFIEDGKLLFVL